MRKYGTDEAGYVLWADGQYIEVTIDQACCLRDMLVEWLGLPDKKPLPHWIPVATNRT